MFRFTQHIFEGALFVHMIIRELELIHGMILNSIILPMELFWDHQHTVLNDSIILSERLKEDYETKRVLNFVSVLNQQIELFNIKKRVLNDYNFIKITFK